VKTSDAGPFDERDDEDLQNCTSPSTITAPSEPTHQRPGDVGATSAVPSHAAATPARRLRTANGDDTGERATPVFAAECVTARTSSGIRDSQSPGPPAVDSSRPVSRSDEVPVAPRSGLAPLACAL